MWIRNQCSGVTRYFCLPVCKVGLIFLLCFFSFKSKNYVCGLCCVCKLIVLLLCRYASCTKMEVFPYCNTQLTFIIPYLEPQRRYNVLTKIQITISCVSTFLHFPSSSAQCVLRSNGCSLRWFPHLHQLLVHKAGDPAQTQGSFVHNSP